MAGGAAPNLAGALAQGGEQRWPGNRTPAQQTKFQAMERTLTRCDGATRPAWSPGTQGWGRPRWVTGGRGRGQPARRRREEGWQLRPVLRIQGIFEKPKGTLDCSVALSLLGEVGGVRALGSPQGALGAEAATSLPPAKGNGTQLPLLPFPTAEPKKALLTRRWGPTGPLGTESFGRREAQRDFQAAASIC